MSQSQVNLSPLQKRISREYNKEFVDVLKELYVARGLTMSEMAKLLDVNLRTIQRWLKDFDIPARKMTWI